MYGATTWLPPCHMPSIEVMEVTWSWKSDDGGSFHNNDYLASLTLWGRGCFCWTKATKEKKGIRGGKERKSSKSCLSFALLHFVWWSGNKYCFWKAGSSTNFLYSEEDLTLGVYCVAKYATAKGFQLRLPFEILGPTLDKTFHWTGGTVLWFHL